MEKTDILSLSKEKLTGFLLEMGEQKFRAKQIFSWLHQKKVTSFDEMTNLSKALQEKLTALCEINTVGIEEKRVSKEDGTRKYLFSLKNGSLVEGVLMGYGHGNTACISTQAGCRMGCTFCASTLGGVDRNLSAGEMLSQIYAMEQDTGEKVAGVVLMGSGEPLDNYDSVLQFLHLIHDPDGFGLGHRHITLSTCGLIDKINELAEEKLQITLAVSLHAPNDTIRREIMPIAKANPLEKLLAATKAYGDYTKRRVTYEYALMQGVNDSDQCAYELAKVLRYSLCHVNLIPVNDVKERGYRRSTEDRIQQFAKILEKSGIPTTIRRKLGSDINAACGQLRKGYLEHT